MTKRLQKEAGNRNYKFIDTKKVNFLVIETLYT